MRVIAHITADAGEGYQHPADVDATLVELSLLAFRLPQALAQARAWLNGRHAAGTVGHDTYPAHTTGTVAAVAGHLNDAIVAAEQLGACLDQARQLTAHLTTSRNPSTSTTDTGTTSTTGTSTGSARGAR